MNCAVHSDLDAVGYCRNCGKAMCSTCVRPVRDVLYCEDCLAGIVGIPAPTPVATPPAGSPYQMPASSLPPGSPSQARSSPLLAFFLGFLPGMGAFYNEQYGKGMIHLAICPMLLIGAGVLLLLHNFDWFPWYRISQFFWPAVLIGAGVLMMRNRLDRRS